MKSNIIKKISIELSNLIKCDNDEYDYEWYFLGNFPIKIFSKQSIDKYFSKNKEKLKSYNKNLYNNINKYLNGN